MQPRFCSLDSESGLEIVDPIENCRFVLLTPSQVSPTTVDSDRFPYPVTAACEVVTEGFRLPNEIALVIRDSDGEYLLDTEWEGTQELAAGEYLLDMNPCLKLYARADTALTVEANSAGVRVAFDGPTRMQIGARSYHTAPEATITVPDDSEAMMRAISEFGSALKTTSCERSWPNLRGHPPAIERGDELWIPDELESPDTGVTIHVPADYDHIYTVAPLSYYLGAEVVSGSPPRLTTNTGFVHRLDTDRGFEAETIRTLQQVFLLDCVTRTEGYYPTKLHAQQVVESRSEIDLDFDDLYDAPLTEQLEAYLSIPFATIESAIPTWHRVAHVRPSVESIELLPFVVDDLALVRVQGPAENTLSPERREKQDLLQSFKRGGPTRRTGVPGPGQYVPLPSQDEAIERVWVGEETPDRGTKLLRAAFTHEQTTPADGTIKVTVVCNDDAMRPELEAVSDVYGSRDFVRFDVDCKFGVSTDDLRTLLAEDTDLFHFIGHIDGRGFECPNGVLDATTVTETGAETVLLNACRSHDQGVALVEAGAKAAIVSLSDIENYGAVEVGETFARLLNYGFTVGGALEVAAEYTSVGREYVALGDPSATVAQPDDGFPILCELEDDISRLPAPDEDVRLTAHAYCSRRMAMGSICEPLFQDPDDSVCYLGPGLLDTFTVPVERLRRMFEGEEVLYVLDDELHWSDGWLFDGTEAECRE